ncbi:chromate transporter [bacterium]|nr:chromate transporter [bacterium]
MIYMLLIVEFFKIGLFSFGGGYATIPFLYQISEYYKWYTLDELTQMIGFASVTPGPIGLNIATFAGVKTAGLLGAILATLSEVIPSFILIILISKILIKYKNNYYVETILELLRPISCALLFFVFVKLALSTLNDLKAIILLFVFIALSPILKRNPIIYILLSCFSAIIIEVFKPFLM